MSGSLVECVPNFSEGKDARKVDGIAAYFYWEKGQTPFVFHLPSCGVEVGLPAAEV